MNKDKEFIKEVKIDKKRRFKYSLITLIIFNMLFLSSLIYMFALITNVFTGVISMLLFALVVVGSIRHLVNTKHTKKCIIYRDKIAIESTTFNGEIDLSKVFMVKSRRNIFDLIFRNSAHMLVIYAKHERKEVFILSFIGEDVNVLADDIMKLAIEARENKNNIPNDDQNQEKLISKTINSTKNNKKSNKKDKI